MTRPTIQKASVYQSVTHQNAVILPPILFTVNACIYIQFYMRLFTSLMDITLDGKV